MLFKHTLGSVPILGPRACPKAHFPTVRQRILRRCGTRMGRFAWNGRDLPPRTSMPDGKPNGMRWCGGIFLELPTGPVWAEMFPAELLDQFLIAVDDEIMNIKARIWSGGPPSQTNRQQFSS